MPHIQNDTDALTKSIKKILIGGSTNKVLRGVCAMIRLPLKCLEVDKEFILKSLKDCMKLASSS